MRRRFGLTSTVLCGILVLTSCGSTSLDRRNSLAEISIMTPPKAQSSDGVGARQQLNETRPLTSVRLLAWVSNTGNNVPTLDVTYHTPNGTTQSIGAVESDERYLAANEIAIGDFVGIAARSNQAAGSVGCKIEASGKIIASNEIRGPYAQVNCTADVLELPDGSQAVP